MQLEWGPKQGETVVKIDREIKGNVEWCTCLFSLFFGFTYLPSCDVGKLAE